MTELKQAPTEPHLYLVADNGLPLIHINSLPDVATGNELANVIMTSMAALAPELVHPECHFN